MQCYSYGSSFLGMVLPLCETHWQHAAPLQQQRSCGHANGRGGWHRKQHLHQLLRADWEKRDMSNGSEIFKAQSTGFWFPQTHLTSTTSPRFTLSTWMHSQKSLPPQSLMGAENSPESQNKSGSVSASWESNGETVAWHERNQSQVMEGNCKYVCLEN